MNALQLSKRIAARPFLLVLLLLALPAAAQRLDPGSTETAPPAASASRSLPPAAVPALPVTSTRRAPVRESLLLRAPAELAGGLVGGAMGTAGGAGAGFILSQALCIGERAGTQNREICQTLATIVGATAGGLVGMPLGVGWTGYGMGANGSAWGAAGGMLLSVVGAGTYYFTGGNQHLAGALLATTPLMAVVGYELTDRAPGSQVSPTLSLTPGGGSLGLQGRF